MASANPQYSAMIVYLSAFTVSDSFADRAVVFLLHTGCRPSSAFSGEMMKVFPTLNKCQVKPVACCIFYVLIQFQLCLACKSTLKKLKNKGRNESQVSPYRWINAFKASKKKKKGYDSYLYTPNSERRVM